MKVAICTPVYGDTRAPFTDCLAQLLIHNGRTAPDVELSYYTMASSDLAANRERIAAAALDDGADWLLWLDSDQTFPRESLQRLLAAGREVVGCNYPFRSHPAGPTARFFSGGRWLPVWTEEEKARQGEIEQVASMGLGVCLVSAAVMRKIERPWFRYEAAGEDAYFFAKLSAAAIPVYVDHGLSWEIGHAGQKIYAATDMLADRDAYLAGMKS